MKSPTDPQQVIRALIQKVATGAEMSRSIGREDARAGMQLILEDKIPEVQAAVFLIGLRMKRETADELAGMLDALLEQVNSVEVDCKHLVDIADIYNGYARYLPITPFLPPLLAACGVSAVCHGLEDIGPKHGLTLHKIYRQMGMDVTLSPQQAADRLTQTGWCYIDQARFAPQLHRLLKLRNLMVKRTGIHTLERLCRPIHATGSNHLLTGYVHTNYLKPYTQLARQAGFDSALVVRGIEGGAMALPTRSTTSATLKNNAAYQCFDSTPEDCGISEKIDLERIEKESSENIQRCIEWGVRALKGQDSPFRKPLIYSGALLLRHLGKVETLQDGAKKIIALLHKGCVIH